MGASRANELICAKTFSQGVVAILGAELANRCVGNLDGNTDHGVNVSNFGP